MARFAWQLLPGIQPPYPTAFLHLQADGQPPVLISGLLDTGASFTALRGPVEQVRLGVADERCVPIPAWAANGAMTWQKLTIVTATLDGHDFRMPVSFSDLLPINLIGRVGIMDLWEIRTDVNGAATEVTWMVLNPRGRTRRGETIGKPTGRIC